MSAERGRYLAEVDAALIAAGEDEGGGYIAYARRIAQLAAERDRLAAAVERTRAFAGEMRDYCSPHGVSALYADRLEARLDGKRVVR